MTREGLSGGAGEDLIGLTNSKYIGQYCEVTFVWTRMTFHRSAFVSTVSSRLCVG
jgi:hypothetical protein